MRHQTTRATRCRLWGCLFVTLLDIVLGQTTTATDINSGSTFSDSTIPVAMVTIAVLGVCIVLGILIAKGVDHCHDRRAIRDDASDISEFTKGLLKAQFLYAFNKSLISKVKGKETVRQRARRMGRIWVAKARKNIRKRQVDEGVIKETNDKEAGKMETGVSLVSVKVIKETSASSSDQNKEKTVSPKKDGANDDKKGDKKDKKQQENENKNKEQIEVVIDMAKEVDSVGGNLDESNDDGDTSTEKKTDSPRAKKKGFKSPTKKKKKVKKSVNKGNTSPKRKKKAGRKVKKKKVTNSHNVTSSDSNKDGSDDADEEEYDDDSDESDDDEDDQEDNTDKNIENKNNNSKRETPDANTPAQHSPTNNPKQSRTKGATATKHGQETSPVFKKSNKGPVKVSIDEKPTTPAVLTIEKETTGSECSSRDDYDFLAQAENAKNTPRPRSGRSSKSANLSSSPSRGQNIRSKLSNISMDSSLL